MTALTTIPAVGDLLILVNERHGASGQFSLGDVVTVASIESTAGTEASGWDVIHVTKPGQSRTVGTYLRAWGSADPQQITDLDTYKRVVVRRALAAATEYGWCSEAQRVLREELGLGDLLPTQKYVDVVSRVPVMSEPGESEARTRQRAQEQVTFTEGSGGYVSSSTIVT